MVALTTRQFPRGSTPWCAAPRCAAQVSGHVQVIDGKPILTVWGTHAERGYAQGYLKGVEGKEIFDDYIVGYCCGGSALTYYFLHLHYTNNYAVDAKYQAEVEVIRRRGPWRGLEDVEFATLEWVHWYNNRRLLEPIGNIPPVEFEEAYCRSQETPSIVAGLI